MTSLQLAVAKRAHHVPVVPCDLPDGIRLVYADDRGRQHTVDPHDANFVDFGLAKPLRKPPAYRGQRNFPGWWWSATARSHVLYESWLERHYIIEADRDARVTGISGQPFALTWPVGKQQARHVPDLFCRLLEGQTVVTDCRPASKADEKFRHEAAVMAAACSHIGWDYRLVGDPDPVWAANLRYNGRPLARYAKAVAAVTVEVVARASPHSFQVLRRRRVVERTFGWLMRYRRLARDYERTTANAEAMIYRAAVIIMTRRPAPPRQRPAPHPAAGRRTTRPRRANCLTRRL